MSESKEYKNEEIKIIWKQELCIHSGNCVRNLPGVFHPQERPWITIENADTEHLIETVKKCPSGALTWKRLEGAQKEEKVKPSESIEIEVFKNGPIAIKGNCEIRDSNGNVTSKSGQVVLCRCGHSKNKPFCDGNHKKEGFEAD